MQRIPKLRGFKNPFRIEYTPVNLDALEAFEGDAVDPDALRGRGLVRKRGLVKVLGRRRAGPGRSRVRGPRLLRRRPRPAITGGRADRHRGPAALRPRPPARAGQRPHQPVGYRPTDGVEEPACSPALANMFRVPDLRNKILFTLLIIAIYQFGRQHPGPLRRLLQGPAAHGGVEASGVLGLPQPVLAAARSPGWPSSASGSCRTSPASIIIQLLATVIPKLEQWRDQGAIGQKKLTQTTRYLTVALALMQSTGLVYLFHKGGRRAVRHASSNIDLILNYSICRGPRSSC